MDRGKPLPRCPGRCDNHPTCFCRARRKQNPAFHSFDLDAAARLRFPFGNADCLASALRGQGSWQCHRYRHKRHVALPPHFRDETSTVEYIDPPELVVAPAEDLAIERLNKLCTLPLRAAWHGCSENAGISRRMSLILRRVRSLPPGSGASRSSADLDIWASDTVRTGKILCAFSLRGCCWRWSARAWRPELL